MISLVITACLASTPLVCVQVEPTAFHFTESTCAVAGMVQGAKWSSDHPDWVIQSWECRKAPDDVPTDERIVDLSPAGDW